MKHGAVVWMNYRPELAFKYIPSMRQCRRIKGSKWFDLSENEFGKVNWYPVLIMTVYTPSQLNAYLEEALTSDGYSFDLDDNLDYESFQEKRVWGRTRYQKPLTLRKYKRGEKRLKVSTAETETGTDDTSDKLGDIGYVRKTTFMRQSKYYMELESSQRKTEALTEEELMDIKSYEFM